MLSSLLGLTTLAVLLSNTGGASSAAVCSPSAAGAAIPQPPAGFNLLNIGSSDAQYDLSLDSLLSSISFPNGLHCRENVVILFPGTAVPTLDTFTSTLTPVFADAANGNADVIAITNPTASLGDVQTTAEYAAFAINYAAVVLGKKATIISWSQGNLDTQWAFKYWPSTRDNAKNYVAISPDYDGTVQASFLCNPEDLLTNNAATLATDFLTDNGSGTSISAILGIGKLPTTATQYKLYLLGLLTGAVPTSATASSSLLGLKKRAVPFGNPQQNHERGASSHVRQLGTDGDPSPLTQLEQGLVGPLSVAIGQLAILPNSALHEVISNSVGNLANLRLPSTIPQGCLPGIWQQTYFSDFVKTLHTDYGNGAGDSAFVPTTTIFSLTDEVVQPQGATGFESASGYLKGASNIFIQGNGGCPIVASTLTSGLPTVITHEGVLYSGMGVAAAILAVKNGGSVTVDMIDPAVRCAYVSPLLSTSQALAQEATIPGALVRIAFGGGIEGLSTSFEASEPSIRSYAT